MRREVILGQELRGDVWEKKKKKTLVC